MLYCNIFLKKKEKKKRKIVTSCSSKKEIGTCVYKYNKQSLPQKIDQAS